MTLQIAETPTGHGLAVEEVPRERYRQPGTNIQAGSETCFGGADLTTGLASDVPDLRNTPLSQVVAAVKNGDAALEEPFGRIAPKAGGRKLLVSAGFNSAI